MILVRRAVLGTSHLFYVYMLKFHVFSDERGLKISACKGNVLKLHSVFWEVFGFLGSGRSLGKHVIFENFANF